MKHSLRAMAAACAGLLLCTCGAGADVGDPQIRTDHPWYPGELACSTFERLFATEAETYQRVVGIEPKTDEQQALAAWLWRNTHYWHGEEGAGDIWGQGYTAGGDLRSREYWSGLFADGFGLCGTTHSQWIAEMEALFGHNRGRCVGVAGHNSFEVFLTGGAYGAGKWVLLDHDLSTVIYNDAGSALLSIPEIKDRFKQLTDRAYAPQKQHGWLVSGLSPEDGAVYSDYNTAEYLAGYSGPPPMVHLRRGETLRRYLSPGLADGKTFVFWGRNYNTAGVPGPERSLTWVNQPDKMHGSTTGAGYHPGQARYANAVYTYQPDFATTNYKEGVVEEDANHIVFEFQTPYVIAATPPNAGPWGIYDAGGRNGLVLHGKTNCQVALTTDDGKTWRDCGTFTDGLDLTDDVKGHHRYEIRFGTGAKSLTGSGLTMTTVCQANVAVLPHLKDGGSRVTYLAGNQAVMSAGPTRAQAQTHIVAGGFDTPTVTLQITAPRLEQPLAIYAAAHIASGNPPAADVKYQIDYSVDGGKSWAPIVKDWSITRRGSEPADFWSQSLCWGAVQNLDRLPTAKEIGPVQVRFHNDGGRKYQRCEAHLVYRTASRDTDKVTFHFADSTGLHEVSHTFPAATEFPPQPTPWDIATVQHVQTQWVEFAPAALSARAG